MASCSELLLLGDEGLDTVVHVLDEVNFVATETSQVGDVIGTIIGLGVFTMDTTDLDVVFVGNGVEKLGLLSELGESDVNGSSQTGTEVGGA